MESNRGNIQEIAVLLETNNTDALTKILEDLSVPDATITVLTLEVGDSFAESLDFNVSSGVQDVQVSPYTIDCITRANVSWQKPFNDGGASVSKYFIVCSSDSAASPPGAIVNFDTFDVTIGPFQPGQFICTVQALNAAGVSVGVNTDSFIVSYVFLYLQRVSRCIFPI